MYGKTTQKQHTFQGRKNVAGAAPGGSGPAHVPMGSEEPRGLKVQPEGLGLDLQTVEAHEQLCVVERHDHIPRVGGAPLA